MGQDHAIIDQAVPPIKGKGWGMNLDRLLQITVALLGAYLAGLWISLIIWTYRDIRARTHDGLVQFFTVLMVLVFNLPGILLYFILRPRETLTEGYERSLEEEALLHEFDTVQACPACKSRVEPEFLVCPFCRTQLRRPCPSCQRPLSLQWKVCPYCGGPVQREVSTPSITEERL